SERGSTMTHKIGLRLTLACLLLAAPVMADTQFRVRRMTRNDVPFGKGQCDIRLQVDNEVEVTLRGDTVFIRTISGRDAVDDGSECNEAVPERGWQGFGFEVRDSRGDIRLIEEPSPRNGNAAVVRIRDSAGGMGRYHFRITWEIGGGGRRGYEPPPPPVIRPGGGGRTGWDDNLNFTRPGKGPSSRRGEGTRNIYEVSVTVDAREKVVAVFNTDGGPRLYFSGFLTNMQGNVLTADLVSGDQTRGLRGSAVITLSRRREVDTVSMEG